MKHLSLVDDEELEGGIRDYEYRILDSVNEIIEETEEDMMFMGQPITLLDSYFDTNNFFAFHIFPLDLKESFIRFI